MDIFTNLTNRLARRHIQDHASAKHLVYYFGYASRVMPCVNDAGSCEYLEVVYTGHARGMTYTMILWLTIFGIVALLAAVHFFKPSRKPIPPSSPSEAPSSKTAQSTPHRLLRTLSTTTTHHLSLPIPRSLLPIFGHTTRLQLLLLALLSAYLTIFTFIGMRYATWITPIKDLPTHHNTRTTLGPWSDRIGVLAYALTPLSILLVTRESLLSLLTGIPYTHFNFLHRWLGYIILLQGALHSLGWILVETWLYQPQPKVWNGFIAQDYARWGVVAMAVIILMWIMSFRVVITRVTGYEFFRKAHYVLGMLYLGACWAHWEPLYFFMLAGLIVWGIDRGVRLLRTAYLHWNPEGEEGVSGFRCVQAKMELFEDAEHGDVVRLEFEHKSFWEVGQHFYLCFPELSIWQSHPFTPASLPVKGKKGLQTHVYIIRAKSGETGKLAGLIRKKLAEGKEAVTSVILTGPHGVGDAACLVPEDVNSLCVAGGTGITYVLPALQMLAGMQNSQTAQRNVELVWSIRRRTDMQWIHKELHALVEAGSSGRVNLKIRIYVTRDDEKTHHGKHHNQRASLSAGDKAIAMLDEKPTVETSSGSSSSHGSSENVNDIQQATTKETEGQSAAFVVQQATTNIIPELRRPDLDAVVGGFVDASVGGPTVVHASGPPGMISDLQVAVARRNSGKKVWRGDDRWDVKLVSDNRMEW